MDEKVSAVVVRKAKVIPVKKAEKRKANTRFDGIPFDPTIREKREALRQKFIAIEEEIAKYPLSIEKELIMTRLEEAFLWCGKLFRNEQARKNLTAQVSKK